MAPSDKESINPNPEKAAFQVHSRLLEDFLSMAHSGIEVEVLKKTLQKSVELSTELTGAEMGSLFLLENESVVTDSILSRGELSSKQRDRVIGSVLDKGLAGWVRERRKVGLITDTDSDDRWITLPNQPYTVRSALAVPIIRGNELFGILTLLHSESDHFSPEMADIMQTTANQMGLALENVRLYPRLEDAKKEIQEYSNALAEEMEKGKKIQRGFLPEHIPEIPNWDIQAFFMPAIQVAGDFYDVFRLPGNSVGLVVADVCDKGVGSALFMALFRSCIRIFSGHTHMSELHINSVEMRGGNLPGEQTGDAINPRLPLQAISMTNTYMEQNHSQMDMFATIFFGVLNPSNGQLFYINAGHEPPFIVNSSGIRHHLMPTGTAVGAIPDAEFKIAEFQLAPGDRLIGYTDGVSEAVSPEGKLFKKDRLKKIIEEYELNAFDLMNRIKTALTQFTGNTPQSDDITILIAQRNK